MDGGVNMRKKLSVLALCMISISSQSTPEDDKLLAERMEWSRNYIAKRGGPVPDGGVTVIPSNKMSTYQDTKEQSAKMRADIAKYGYLREKNDPNNNLFNLKTVADNDLRHHGKDFKPGNTHLKVSISDIRMAYTFLGVPLNAGIDSVGFAPYTTYIEGKGWAGAAHFFMKDGIGSCVFSESNVKLTHGAIIIPEEDARHDINDKTTTVLVTGTPESKFLYAVDWYDTTFFRRLECANDKFDSSITESIIELAKRIDANQ